MRRLPIVVACFALTAFGVGCGSSKKSSTSSTTTPKSTATTPAKSPSSGGVSVSIKDIKYNPQAITVKVGQTIKWTNNDAIAHTVTAKSGAKFDSGTMDSNKTFTFKPTKAGTINYVCLIHPGQTGTITVTK